MNHCVVNEQESITLASANRVVSVICAFAARRAWIFHAVCRFVIVEPMCVNC